MHNKYEHISSNKIKKCSLSIWLKWQRILGSYIFKGWWLSWLNKVTQCGGGVTQKAYQTLLSKTANVALLSLIICSNVLIDIGQSYYARAMSVQICDSHYEVQIYSILDLFQHCALSDVQSSRPWCSDETLAFLTTFWECYIHSPKTLEQQAFDKPSTRENKPKFSRFSEMNIWNNPIHRYMQIDHS